MEEKKRIAGQEIQNLKTRIVIDRAMVFADNIVKHFIALYLNVDVKELFDTVVPTVGVVVIDNKHTLQLGVVTPEYKLDLQQYSNDETVLKYISGLFCLARIIYTPLQKNLEIGHELQLGSNNTLYLKPDDPIHIGIILGDHDTHIATPVDSIQIESAVHHTA